jgi:ribosomal protein S12 methylthiotransferase accessory factor
MARRSEVALPAAAPVAMRWELEPSSKLSRLLPRVVPPEVTESRARACMARIPVTRLSDLAPLDPLRLPAYCAVTPLARDLTTHLGKGQDAAAARASALMEAIERASAEHCSQPACRTSFARLSRSSPRTRGALVIDPVRFDLPDDTGYRRDRTFTWVRATDLVTGRPAWLPLDLAINPPLEGVLRDVDTNGLASGNTWLEAVVHGLCEVIERDAASQLLFADLFAGKRRAGSPCARSVDVRTLPPSSAVWLERIERAGLTLSVDVLDNDLGLPVFRCLLLDPTYPAPEAPAGVCDRRFVGYGADPCAELALLRAIGEAVQARLAVVQGARDSFNRLPPTAAASTPGSTRAPSTIAFGEVPSFESDDLRDDLRFLLARLRGAGFEHALVVDLTRPDLSMAVVRVRVPGLSSFLVNRRRVGWRCLRHLL